MLKRRDVAEVLHAGRASCGDMSSQMRFGGAVGGVASWPRKQNMLLGPAPRRRASRDIRGEVAEGPGGWPGIGSGLAAGHRGQHGLAPAKPGNATCRRRARQRTQQGGLVAQHRHCARELVQQLSSA